jgi:flagellar hook assembly protein FlgD
VSGRIVKEISLTEFGPIRLGHNQSQFVWNGTDEYGDRLANGVYLYKVFAKINGQEIKHRSSAADQGFNKGWGKMYILR